MSIGARVCAGLAAGLVLVILAGCASPRQPVPSVTPSVTPSARTELPPWANGDCTHLLDPVDVAASLGGSTNAMVGTGPLYLGVVGGIGCVFNFGEQGFQDSSQVLLTVAPLEIAGPGELASSLAPEVCDHGINLMAQDIGCSATVAVAGWWYTLRVFSFRSAQAQQASFEAITTMLKQALTTAHVPARAKAVEPFDCKAADTGGLPVTSSRVMPTPQDGAILVAAARLAEPVMCAFTTVDGSQWYVDVYPDSVSPYDQCMYSLFSGSLVSVPGVKSAFAVAPDEGEAQICATDGTSAVTVHRDLDSGAGISDRASLAIVSSLAVPVLGAAG
jgi:hypothetical protein